MIEIRWHGRGGQGAFTAAKLLGYGAVLEGKYALAFPSFGPERRGAPIQAFTKISEAKIQDRSKFQYCDYIIYLDETLYSEEVKKELKPGGIVFLNSFHPERYAGQKDVIAMNGTKLAMELLGVPVTNTVMLGAFLGKVHMVQEENIKAALGMYLAPKLAKKNEILLDLVYEEMRKSTGGAGI